MKLELSSFDNNSNILKFCRRYYRNFFLNDQQRNPFK